MRHAHFPRVMEESLGVQTGGLKQGVSPIRDIELFIFYRLY